MRWLFVAVLIAVALGMAGTTPDGSASYTRLGSWFGLSQILLATLWAFHLSRIVEVSDRLLTARWQYRGTTCRLPLDEIVALDVKEDTTLIVRRDSPPLEIPTERFAGGEAERFREDLRRFLQVRIWPSRRTPHN